MEEQNAENLKDSRESNTAIDAEYEITKRRYKAERLTAQGTLILAIATLILTSFELIKISNDSNKQRKLQNATNEDICYKYYQSYFTPEFRKVFQAIDMDWLTFIPNPGNKKILEAIVKKNPGKFPSDTAWIEYMTKKFPGDVSNEYPIFWIDQRYRPLMNLDSNKEYYSIYEMDDIVLNPIDNMGNYYNKKLITDEDYINNLFGWYIQTIWQNEAIMDCVKWSRTIYYEESIHYHGFQNLYLMLKEKYMTKKFNTKMPDDYYMDTRIRYNSTSRCVEDSLIIFGINPKYSK